MLPVKEILEMRHFEPRPPILSIDETTIKCTNDVGPVCGCDEKYELIKNYTPFLPGAINPYARRKTEGTADTNCLEVYWKRLKIGACDLIFDKPQAVYLPDLPGKLTLPKEPQDEDLMYLKQPKYTKGYLLEKVKQCTREHMENCNCPDK